MKFLKKIFELNGRLDRKGYLLFGVLPMVGIIFLLSLFSRFQNSNSIIVFYLLIFSFLLVWILALISAVKRGRDSGLNGLVTLLLFGAVPEIVVVSNLQIEISSFNGAIFLFIVYLLLIPSTSKELKVIGKIEYGFTIIFMGLVSIIWIDLVSPKSCMKSEDWIRGITCSQMESIANVLDTFKMDNEAYPSTKEGLKSLVSNPDVLKYPNYAQNPYFKRVPKDAWGHKYIYVKTTDGFEIISYGADREEGGEDEGADIFYSECK